MLQRHYVTPYCYSTVIQAMHLWMVLQAEAMGHEGVAAKIMAKHSREEHRSSLSITIMEARGLRPRHGECTP